MLTSTCLRPCHAGQPQRMGVAGSKKVVPASRRDQAPGFRGLFQTSEFLAKSNQHISYPQHQGKINTLFTIPVKCLTSWSWDSFFLEDRFKCFSKMPQYFSVSLSYFFLASWHKEKGEEKESKMWQELKPSGSRSFCSSARLHHSLSPHNIQRLLFK